MKDSASERAVKLRQQLSAQATQMSKTLLDYYVEKDLVSADPARTPRSDERTSAESKIKECLELLFDSQCSVLITQEKTEDDGKADMVVLGTDVSPLAIFLMAKHLRYFAGELTKDLAEFLPGGLPGLMKAMKALLFINENSEGADPIDEALEEVMAGPFGDKIMSKIDA